MNVTQQKPTIENQQNDRMTSQSAGFIIKRRNLIVILHAMVTFAFHRDHCQTSFTRRAEK